jgi:hypothetical protein
MLEVSVKYRNVVPRTAAAEVAAMILPETNFRGAAVCRFLADLLTVLLLARNIAWGRKKNMVTGPNASLWNTFTRSVDTTTGDVSLKFAQIATSGS